MKNVTGYDLVKLMAGSWGTLGVMTEVSLKVMAIPETETTLVGKWPVCCAGGGESLSAALGSPFRRDGRCVCRRERPLCGLRGLKRRWRIGRQSLRMALWPGSSRFRVLPRLTFGRELGMSVPLRIVTRMRSGAFRSNPRTVRVLVAALDDAVAGRTL